jgi:hypothetical protein
VVVDAGVVGDTGVDCFATSESKPSPTFEHRNYESALAMDPA